MWFIFALIAGIFFAINSLIIRYYSKNNNDAMMTSFFFSFFSSIILLPFFIFEFKVTNSLIFWGGILLMGVILVISNMMSFKAAQLVDASTQNTVGKLRLLWMIIAGVIIFNEIITARIIIGMILILIAALLIIDYKKWNFSKKGILLIVLATITSTFYAILLKKVVDMSGVLTVTFLVCLFPAIINALVIPNFLNKIKKKIINLKLLIAIALVGVIANLALIKALSYEVLSGVYFIMDASLIVVLFGEHLVLKEKERIGWKIVAVLFAILGAILIHIT